MPLREKVPTAEEGIESGGTVVAIATASANLEDHHDPIDAPASMPTTEQQMQLQQQRNHQDDLSMLQAATLLTADCLGVGILALPKDVNELGWIVGLGFLLVNLPINYYSGKILAITASHVEEGESKAGVVRMRKARSDFEMVATTDTDAGGDATGEDGGEERVDTRSSDKKNNGSLRERNSISHGDDTKIGVMKGVVEVSAHNERHNQHHEAGDCLGVDGNTNASTHDFIGITTAIFPGRIPAQMVMAIYFVNIFLVLGDYILVMSYAVAAMLGDKICLPWAGVLASILMFALAQLRTMSQLGREASIISLLCLFVVLIQCLVALQEHAEPPITARTSVVGDSVLLRKFSALASIGFAMGSQKLFLNIRHEMRYKEEAPRTLICSLSAYGTAYIAVVVLAGTGTIKDLFANSFETTACIDTKRFSNVLF